MPSGRSRRYVYGNLETIRITDVEMNSDRVVIQLAAAGVSASITIRGRVEIGIGVRVCPIQRVVLHMVYIVVERHVHSYHGGGRAARAGGNDARHVIQRAA